MSVGVSAISSALQGGLPARPPIPRVLLLAVLEFYLLHGGDKLVGLVVVDGLLLKEFIIKYLSTPEEESKPTAIKQAAEHENGKDKPIIG